MPLHRAVWLLPVVLLVACSKAPQRPHGKDPLQPDETTGVQGVCFRGPERRPCVGARVVLQQVGPGWGGVQRFGATTDAAGHFRLPVPPGRYSLAAYDTGGPAGRAPAPLEVTVEPGRYAEVEVDADKPDGREPAK